MYLIPVIFLALIIVTFLIIYNTRISYNEYLTNQEDPLKSLVNNAETSPTTNTDTSQTTQIMNLMMQYNILSSQITDIKNQIKDIQSQTKKNTNDLMNIQLGLSQLTGVTDTK